MDTFLYIVYVAVPVFSTFLLASSATKEGTFNSILCFIVLIGQFLAIFIVFAFGYSLKNQISVTSAAIFSYILTIIICFASIYRSSGIVDRDGLNKNPSAVDCLYLSIITWTTVGYGDIAPLGIGRLAAACEALIGYFSMAFLIATLTKFLDHTT